MAYSEYPLVVKCFEYQGLPMILAVLAEAETPGDHARSIGMLSLEVDSFVKAVNKARKKSPWGWCMIRIVCEVEGFILGESELGCCSYSSEKDFVKNSGYFNDMCKEVYNASIEKYNKLSEVIRGATSVPPAS